MSIRISSEVKSGEVRQSIEMHRVDLSARGFAPSTEGAQEAFITVDCSEWEFLHGENQEVTYSTNTQLHVYLDVEKARKLRDELIAAIDHATS